MLVIYLFGSVSLLSFHNHNKEVNEDHSYTNCQNNDHHDDVLFCENSYQNLFSDFDCSHNSHLTISKENCSVCDHFSSLNLAILKNKIDYNYKLFFLKTAKYSTSAHVIDLANTLNKSPPFII